MNTNGFTQWKKELEEGELANYTAYQIGKNRIAIFENGEALLDCCYHNLKAFGGNGTWRPYGREITPDKVDQWMCGNDFNTLSITAEAFRGGFSAEKYLSRVEDMTRELYERYPRLYELSKVSDTKKRRRRFNEDEGELDIDRYMSGDPAMFASMPRMSVKGRSITFQIELGMSGSTEHTATTEGVIAALALVNIVEKAGISTEIIMTAIADEAVSDAHLSGVAVIAKRADEPLDVSRLLSFAMTGVYRCFFMQSRANITHGKAHTAAGYSRWSFDSHPEYFAIFDSFVKCRVRDSYWRNNQMNLMIGQVFEFLGETSPAS
jgi:hypothetical protein